MSAPRVRERWSSGVRSSPRRGSSGGPIDSVWQSIDAVGIADQLGSVIVRAAARRRLRAAPESRPTCSWDQAAGNVSKRLLFALLATVLFAGAIAAPADAAGIRIVRHGPRTANVVALTFDDGWSLPRCRQILGILEAERVPATFMPIGGYVRRDASFWLEVARLGYPIGNHTAHHPDLSKLSYQQQLDEIVKARDTMAFFGIPMVPLFRPPYGAWNGDTLIAAEAAGYSEFLVWDTTMGDTSRGGNDSTHFHEAVRGKAGSIVLMHCGPAMTPRLLPKVIESYRSRGFQFVTVPQLLGIPGPLPRFLPRPMPPLDQPIPVETTPIFCPSSLLSIPL
jgi:peptidoglycan/xylan/chitin deacetylase (PgdA/CDA1 family)